MHVPVVQAQNGSTALHNAAANGHAKAVEALVAAPACDCDVQNSNGNTALHLAASKGQFLLMLHHWCAVTIVILSSSKSCRSCFCAAGMKFKLFVASLHRLDL